MPRLNKKQVDNSADTESQYSAGKHNLNFDRARKEQNRGNKGISDNKAKGYQSVDKVS